MVTHFLSLSSLYIWIWDFYLMIYKYFLPICGLSFNSFLPCGVQKLFSLQSCLFLFLVPVFLGHSQEIIAQTTVTRLSPFSSIIISGIIWKSSIHLDLCHVKGGGIRIYFHFLHMDIQFSQHYSLRRLFFPHCKSLASLLKISCL
jgi:hypothetical protein